MTSKRRPKARARTFHRLGGALVVGASAAAVVIVPELRSAEATPPKALHAPPQQDLAPSPFPAPLGSMPPAPPLSMRAPLAAPAPRQHVPHVSRDEGSGCGKSFRAPFDGSLALRSAYRSARPHSYMFCPTWSSFGPVRGGHRFHGGIDVSAPTGTPVRAATDGTLTYARDPGGYGLFARVRFPHPKRGRDGTCSGSGEVEIIYAHLQEDSGKVSAPARHVRAGEIVGKVGCTGNAKGMCSPSPESHLHVTVQRTDGARARIDPPAFLGWHVRTPEDGDKAAEWAACGGGAPLSAARRALHLTRGRRGARRRAGDRTSRSTPARPRRSARGSGDPARRCRRSSSPRRRASASRSVRARPWPTQGRPRGSRRSPRSASGRRRRSGDRRPPDARHRGGRAGDPIRGAPRARGALRSQRRPRGGGRSSRRGDPARRRREEWSCPSLVQGMFPERHARNAHLFRRKKWLAAQAVQTRVHALLTRARRARRTSATPSARASGPCVRTPSARRWRRRRSRGGRS